MPPLQTAYASQSKAGILVPPLNFAHILPGVYRSGHPNAKNFPFMDTLGLKSIMYLSSDDYRHDTLSWAESRGLKIFHHRLESSKEPFEEVDEDRVVQALEDIIDTRNLPILIHDNKGRLLPSILSALLRLMNRWSFTSVLAEYRSFLPDEKVWAEGEVGKPDKGRERIADLEFIDRFPLERVTYDPRYRPDWLE
ncbi:tyrosine phosphatase family-domain-containing protein [Leucosporidium creatinivorum]|uniref:Tyrosine phosphatase family-domain-containing protein n=1 Tax=Leucosporidium creatinivorum TaxID=106004 RepID=A0A1Y2F7U4_9BASI|nr:tyrosine phosphatase family-domain-containing protein [Leucosporidium creatinivorum]